MDFYGFSFNGYHSSELGFIRTSDGDRYNDTVGPNFQDKTVAIPGGDGTYFFDSYYTQKPFTINIAFDSMTEMQLRKVRQVFNGKDVGPLIFDEEPYKAYTVKLQSPIQLKYICFDKYDFPTKSLYDFSINTDTRLSQERVYKGEGTINFIAYKPYAESRHLYLDDFDPMDDEDTIAIKNMAEWQEASGMLKNAGELQIASALPTSAVEPDDQLNIWVAYNPGDVDMGFKLYVNKEAVQTRFPTFEIDQVIIDADDSEASTRHGYLRLDFTALSSRLEADDEATLICLNTTNELIEGCTSAHDGTGYLYNDAIKEGYLFKIPPCPTKRHASLLQIISSESSVSSVQVGASSSSVLNIASVNRHYLYY